MAVLEDPAYRVELDLSGGRLTSKGVLRSHKCLGRPVDFDQAGEDRGNVGHWPILKKLPYTSLEELDLTTANSLVKGDRVPCAPLHYTDVATLDAAGPWKTLPG